MKFGLLGRKLSHSYSPQIHAHIADYEYRLFEKEPDEVADFLMHGDFCGINVTIPYKETVMQYMSTLSPAAQRIGAVNTVTRLDDGSLYGDNTDYYGFSYLLESAGFNVEGKKVLVLGSGGASKTAVCVCADKGAREVLVISRSGKNNYDNIAEHADADFIINATPVGMYPNNGKSPIDLEIFRNLSGVADMIYNPAKTALLLKAEKLGIPFTNGLVMLCAQGVKAAESFLKREIPKQKIHEILTSLRREMLNITLVGMPGCGKSTAASLLAQRLNKALIDTDEMIVKNESTAIPQIFAQHGEEYFRNAESIAVSAACKQSGKIIATGGGAVLREENKAAIKQNSIVIFLNRSTEQLDKDGRPLSQSGDLNEMYKKRLPHYKAVCDYEIQVSSDANETLERILEVI